MSSILQSVFRDASSLRCTDSRIALMARCGSGELGHHRRTCDTCGEEDWIPNACRCRACPFCRAREIAEWVRTTEATLPQVPYFHVVFTVPGELRVIARTLPAMFNNILMDAVRESILDICGDLRHLGATPLMFAVLHTWNQRMHLHPHVHVVISAGGLTPDGAWKWPGGNRQKGFLVPHRILRARFQTLLINKLLAKYDSGDYPDLAKRWTSRSAFKHFLLELRKKSWSLHMKRPLRGPAAIVRYLAKYVNRIAISDSRVIGYDGENVTFTWQDRANGNRTLHEVISAKEFVERFRQHLPPKRFIRIRFWGLLAHRKRQKTLKQVAQALEVAPPVPDSLPAITRQAPETSENQEIRKGPACKKCETGTMIFSGFHLRPSQMIAHLNN